eukprot:TRINITY_DN1869_c2_g1_i1.p1 TRINITY_DN1869_c2_g1~~TRINITY_DN1869_c2_g1_i1.p1  ORF type:complete len:618 (+),score=127.50 TRINITY_DN1869_c2_g1_i1:133-1986(+)
MFPVHIVFDGLPLYFEVGVSDTTEDLKELISKEQGLLPESFDILHEGERLLNEKGIIEYGIPAEAELQVEIKHRWQAQARIRSQGLSYDTEAGFEQVISEEDADPLLVQDFIEVWLPTNDGIKTINKMLVIASDVSSNLRSLLSHEAVKNHFINDTSIRVKVLTEAVHNSNISSIEVLANSGTMTDDDFNAKANGTPLLMLTDVPQISELLLSNGADVDGTDSLRRTPLISACKKGERETVKLLLGYQPDLSKKDAQNRTAFMEACAGGSEGCVGVLMVLLQYILQLSSNMDIKNTTKPAYIRSIVNATSLDGISPLMEACRNESDNHIDIIRLLFCNNTYVSESIHKTDRYGRTPLMHACRNTNSESHEAVKILLANNAVLSLHLKDDDGRTALAHSCVNLIASDEIGTPTAAEAVLEHTSDVNIVDNFHRTALHHVVRSTSLSAVAVAEKIISKSGDPNLADCSGRTPFLDACDNRGKYSTRLIEVLLAGSISPDVNLSSNDGRSPLMEVCRNPVFPQNVNSLKVLLKHSPDLFLADQSSHTALQYAAGNIRDGGELLARLEAANPQEFRKKQSVDSKVQVVNLSRPSASLRVRSWMRESSRWWAATKGNRVLTA